MTAYRTSIIVHGEGTSPRDAARRALAWVTSRWERGDASVCVRTAVVDEPEEETQFRIARNQGRIFTGVVLYPDQRTRRLSVKAADREAATEKLSKHGEVQLVTEGSIL